MAQGKVSRTYRLTPEQAAGLKAYAESLGATETAAVGMLIESAGSATAAPAAPARNEEEPSLVAALREHNESLRAQVATLTAQLEVKDEQIRSAHALADQAQRLHAAQEVKLLEDKDGKERRGLVERIRTMFGGAEKEAQR